jgi:hypothetical protein
MTPYNLSDWSRNQERLYAAVLQRYRRRCWNRHRPALIATVVVVVLYSLLTWSQEILKWLMK